MKNPSVEIPTLVRIKPRALDRLGLYARRVDFRKVVLLFSAGLPEPIMQRTKSALEAQKVAIVQGAPNSYQSGA